MVKSIVTLPECMWITEVKYPQKSSDKTVTRLNESFVIGLTCCQMN